MARPKAVVSWSSGKDSAYALAAARQAGELDVVGLLTTLTAPFERVSMHGVREALLDRQAAALGLPCVKVRIPSPCPNEVYEAAMGQAVAELARQGVSRCIFGDLFLEDIRAYREAKLRPAGIQAVFPLWARETRALAEAMLADGVEAILTCVDSRRLDRSFAGRRFDRRLLEQLPPGVDPCGENGEFHSFVTAAPGFSERIEVKSGEVVERDGFVFADVLPNAATPHTAQVAHGG